MSSKSLHIVILSVLVPSEIIPSRILSLRCLPSLKYDWETSLFVNFIFPTTECTKPPSLISVSGTASQSFRLKSIGVVSVEMDE